MNIKLLLVGKTESDFINEGYRRYNQRLSNYIKFNTIIIPANKKTKLLSVELQKQKEGELILKNITNSDFVILLDEKGKEFASVDFAKYLQGKMNSGIKNIIFIIGGPYGFSDEVYKKANEKIALSKLTFTHEMVRLFFVEQLYRAFSILRNEPYHH